MSVLKPNRRADRKSNTKYLNYIRSMPCCICILPWKLDGSGVSYSNVQKSPTEAAHSGPHALGSKSDDLSAFPLCESHHREGIDAYHRVGPKRFEQIHRVNIAAIVDELNARFEAEVGRGARVPYAREVTC